MTRLDVDIATRFPGSTVPSEGELWKICNRLITLDESEVVASMGTAMRGFLGMRLSADTRMALEDLIDTLTVSAVEDVDDVSRRLARYKKNLFKSISVQQSRIILAWLRELCVRVPNLDRDRCERATNYWEGRISSPSP